MSLSRKRHKELDRLRGDAEELWQAQQAVLDRASVVAREARRQATHYTREEVAPRVREGYDSYVRPRVETGVDLGRKAAHTAGDLISTTLVPAVGTVLGTALSVVDVAQDTRVQAAVKRLRGSRAAAEKAVQKSIGKQKSGAGFGTYLAVGVGIVALAGIGYAVWQTFRADDELWVADDETPAAPAE